MSGTVHACLLVFGAGGHGRVVADAARATGDWQEIAFVDDRYPDLKQSGPWPVVGRFADAAALLAHYPDAALGVGNNGVRAAMYERLQGLGYALPPVVHPSAVVSPDTSIAAGAVVLARAIVNIGAEIGPAAIVNSAAVIEHDCKLGLASHVCPAAALAGDVEVGPLATIGIGTAVRQCMRIGAGATVGAGAAVVAHVAEGLTVAGVPARAMRPCAA